MVRILLLFWPLLLFGVSLQERVAFIIGKQKYEQNRIVINTVFSRTSYFYKNGSIDLFKVVKTLQRLGLIPQKYATLKKESIEFVTYSHTPLFFKLTFDALQEATVLNYAIKKIAQDSDGGFVSVQYISSLVPDPIKIMHFFKKNGGKVLTLSHIDNRWLYVVDFSNIFLAAPKLQKNLHFTHIRQPIWIAVEGGRKIVLKAKRAHWYPKLYIFNEQFEPVEVVRKRAKLRQIVLKLPKGRYYIKIADTFTLNNIQSGIDVFAQ